MSERLQKDRIGKEGTEYMKQKDRHHRKVCRRRIVRNSNAGVAMVTVLIVSAVVMVFCLSLLLVTYTLFAQTSRQVTQLQCKLLAQSMSETLGEELKDPDSELTKYLGQQIEDGYWISQNAPDTEEEKSPAANAVTELLLDLDDGDALGEYQISVTLTYSLNLADDDGSSEGDEKDDQDQDPSGQEGGLPAGNPNGEGKQSEAGNGSYAVKASICCTRGDKKDRDAQSYTIEAEYPAVSM